MHLSSLFEDHMSEIRLDKDVESRLEICVCTCRTLEGRDVCSSERERQEKAGKLN
jgi:hypothetical protein